MVVCRYGLGLCLGLLGCGPAPMGAHQFDPGSDSSATNPAHVPAAQVLRQQSHHLFACQNDADCVEVPHNGCHSGLLDAVHKDRVNEYLESSQANGCPLIFVIDTRRAYCDIQAGQCRLIFRDSHDQTST